MSAPVSLAKNRMDFNATFTGKEPSAARRSEVAQEFSKATGIPADGAQCFIRFYDNFTALKDQLNLPADKRSVIDMYETCWGGALASDSLDPGKMTQIATAAMEVVPMAQSALQQADLRIAPNDRVRLLSSCLKSMCAALIALEKQNSLLATHTTLVPSKLRALIGELGGQLAAEKLKRNEIETKPATEEDAKKALKHGGKAIGYHVDHVTGKITFVELEVRNSLLGVGGRLTPKLEGDRAQWRASTAFVKIFTEGQGPPPVLVQMPTPFPAFENLPESIRNFQGVSGLDAYQRQSLLDEVNSKWQGWEDAYKKDHHPDEAGGTGDELAARIIEQATVKQAIETAIAAAAKVPQAEPETPA